MRRKYLPYDHHYITSRFTTTVGGKCPTAPKTMNELVNEAVEHYFRDQQRTKLDREIAAYEKQHPILKQTYLGQWVAIHQGQLVDHDPDGPSLYRRIRANYSSLPSVVIYLQTVG